MAKKLSINKMPLTIAQDILRAKQLINGNTSTTQIVKYTKINHATIYRLRNHIRSLNNITIDTCWKLANYPDSKPLDYSYLRQTCQHILKFYNNLAEVSRLTHISRTTLQNLQHNKGNLKRMNVYAIAKLLSLGRLEHYIKSIKTFK